MPAFTPQIGRFGDVTPRGWAGNVWLKRHTNVIWTLILVILLGIGGVGGWWYWQSQYEPAHGGIVHEGMIGQPEHLNPLYSHDNPVDAEITPLIFRGLLQFNQQQQLEPDLAKNYQRSDDGKTYTITLGKNFWQDGRPVTSADVAFTIKATQDPAYHGSWSKNFTNVSVSTPDASHVILTLKDAYAPFAQNLTLGILPEHLLRGKTSQQLQTDSFNLAPVGTGVLHFAKITVNPKDKFVDELAFTIEHGYLDEVAFNFYHQASQAETDFKLGKLQALGNVYSGDLQDLHDFPAKHSQEWTLTGQSYALFFNLSSHALKDLWTRQALAYDTPRDQIISSVFNSHASPLDGVYPANNPVRSSRAETYTFDLSKAKSTLGGLTDPPSKLTLLIPDMPLHRQVADKVAAAWKDLGITTTIVAKSGDDLTQTINKRKGYDVVLLGELSEPDPDRYANWHSTQVIPSGLNITGESNKWVDKSLEDGRKTLDENERKQDYDTFQYYLAKDAPVIWLYQPHYVYVWSNKLQGVKIDHPWQETDRFDHIDQWYLKTQRRTS